MNSPQIPSKINCFGEMYGKQHDAFASNSPTQVLAMPLEAGRNSEHVHQSAES